MAADGCQIGQVCGRRAGGGILKRLEGRVLLQALGQVLGGLRVEVVAAETANEKGVGLSMAADVHVGQACAGARSSVPDARQRLVHGEHVGDVFCSLSLERILAEAANENQKWMRWSEE